MLRGQLAHDTPLVERQFPFPLRLVDPTQFVVGLDVGGVPLQPAQTEPERPLQVAALAISGGQLDERRRARVGRDLRAQLLQRSTRVPGH